MKATIPITDRLLMTLLEHPQPGIDGLYGWVLADFAGREQISLADLNGAFQILEHDGLILPCAREGNPPRDLRGATRLYVRLTSKGRDDAERRRLSYQPWWSKKAAWVLDRALAAGIGAVVTLIVTFLLARWLA